MKSQDEGQASDFKSSQNSNQSVVQYQQSQKSMLQEVKSSQGDQQGRNNIQLNPYDNEQDEYNEEDLEQIEEQIPEWKRKWNFSKTKIPNIQRVHQLSGEDRYTFDVLTKHEFVKVIGLRAKQIYANAALYLNVPSDMERSKNMIEIAKKQVKLGLTPFVIQRIHPSGEFERWSLQQLAQ